MANLKVPNLCGEDLKFNAIQLEFENLIDDAINKLEADPSDAVATALAIFNTLDAEMVNLVPKIPSLPDVSLQSQLKDLSKLTPGSLEHIALLAAIALKFGTEIKAKGYDLDDLVKVALAAIVAGTDLCAKVPNFVVPADGLSAAVEKAVESKQSTVDSAEEAISVVVPNAHMKDARAALTTAINLMKTGVPFPVEQEDAYEEDVAGNPNLVSGTTPPTEDVGDFVVAKKTTVITSNSGFKVTSTTAEDAVEKTTETEETDTETNITTTTTTETTKEQGKPATAQTSAGGSVPTESKTPTDPPPKTRKKKFRRRSRRRRSKRKNVAPKGFVGRKTLMVETFSKLDGNSVTLKHEPHSIQGPSIQIRGRYHSSARGAVIAYYSDKDKRGEHLPYAAHYKFATGINAIRQKDDGTTNTYSSNDWKGDTFTINGKVLTITQGKGGPYGGTILPPYKSGGNHNWIKVPKGTILEVTYWYDDTYDPRFATKGNVPK